MKESAVWLSSPTPLCWEPTPTTGLIIFTWGGVVSHTAALGILELTPTVSSPCSLCSSSLGSSVLAVLLEVGVMVYLGMLCILFQLM